MIYKKNVFAKPRFNKTASELFDHILKSNEENRFSSSFKEFVGKYQSSSSSFKDDVKNSPKFFGSTIELFDTGIEFFKFDVREIKREDFIIPFKKFIFSLESDKTTKICYVYESEPFKIHILTFVANPEIEQVGFEFHEYTLDKETYNLTEIRKENPHFSYFLSSLLFFSISLKYCTRKKQCGKLPLIQRKIGNIKKPIKVNRVYFLGQKPFDQFKIHNLKKTDIEWQYSFQVMGHWRKLGEGKTGKDRSDEYVVNGYTWVRDYVKGEGDLNNSIRITKT